jgi:hypothetical protein
MGADYKGQYMRRCLGVNTRIGKTCCRIPDRLPARRSTQVCNTSLSFSPHPSSVRSAFPRFPAAACADAGKIRPADERKLFCGGNFLSSSKHTANAFPARFRSSPLGISRHTSCRSISLPIPKELEGLTMPDQDLRAPKSSLYSLLSVSL